MLPTLRGGTIGNAVSHVRVMTGTVSHTAALLARIEVLPLAVVLAFERPPRFLPQSGALFHGAFGRALHRVACLRPGGRICRSRCRRPDLCPYALLFEGTSPAPVAWMRRQERRPLPLVLRPPLEGSREELLLEVVLVGRAVRRALTVIAAVELMAAQGLGRSRQRALVRRVYQREPGGGIREVYRPDRGLLARPQAWSLAMEPPEGRISLCLRFVSPLRLQVRGKILAKPTFEDVVFGLERRLTSLAVLYNEGIQPPGPDPELRRAAAAARSQWVEHRWEEVTRYSARQGRRMTLGGVCGTLQVEGAAGRVVPLLRAGEIVHVGKAVSFGFGRFKLFIGPPG